VEGLAAKRKLVVTSNGRPIAILSAVTDQTHERALAATRRSRAVAAVSEIQRLSVQRGHTGGITQPGIDSEIAAVRRARRKL
jgi:hypothetical protein